MSIVHKCFKITFCHVAVSNCSVNDPKLSFKSMRIKYSLLKASTDSIQELLKKKKKEHFKDINMVLEI